MVEIAYSTVMDVTLSWDKLKHVKNYQDKAGDLIFTRLFEIEPSAKKLFQFSETGDVHDNAKYATHAKQMVDMIDCAVATLGPDMEPLEEELMRLGKRHLTHYGVTSRYLPVMEKAVIFAMEELLDSKFTRQDRNAWQVVFHFMVKKMVEGMEQ